MCNRKSNDVEATKLQPTLASSFSGEVRVDGYLDRLGGQVGKNLPPSPLCKFLDRPHQRIWFFSFFGNESLSIQGVSCYQTSLSVHAEKTGPILMTLLIRTDSFWQKCCTVQNGVTPCHLLWVSFYARMSEIFLPYPEIQSSLSHPMPP